MSFQPNNSASGPSGNTYMYLPDVPSSYSNTNTNSNTSTNTNDGNDGSSSNINSQVPSSTALHNQFSSLSTTDDAAAAADATAAFTTEDEQKELATVSPTELADAETDLRGLTTQFGGLTLGSGGGGSGGSGGPGTAARMQIVPTPHQITLLSAAEASAHAPLLGPALLQLDAEIAALPLETRQDYLTAMCRAPPTPHQSASEGDGWDCYRSAFLEREGYDPTRAARRLCKYWSTRASIFGRQKFCPVSQRGGDMALAECFTSMELEQYLRHNVFHLLEERDGAGRAVFLINPMWRDLGKFSGESQMKALFYLFQKIVKDPTVRRRGFVVVVNMKIPAKKFDRSSMRALLPFIHGNLPLRCRGVHLIDPSAIAYYVVLPVVRYFLGREMRLRLKVHYGSQANIASSLAEYQLTSQCLPEQVGGSVVIDREAWMARRLMEEGQMLQLEAQEQQQQQIQQQQPQQQVQQQIQQQQQPQQQVQQQIQPIQPQPQQEAEPNFYGQFDPADFEPDPIKEAPVDSNNTVVEADFQSSTTSFLADLEPLPIKFEPPPPEKRRRSDLDYFNENDTSAAAHGPEEAYLSDMDTTPVVSGISPAGGERPPLISSPPLSGPCPSASAPYVAISSASSGVNAASVPEPELKRKTSKGSVAAGAAVVEALGKEKTKKGKGGRMADPRMNKAIAAKMSNNEIPLREALEAGGFVFPKTDGKRCKASNIVDADGVSLSQRKNQLSRRIRMLRQQLQEEEENGKSGVEPKLISAKASAPAENLTVDDIVSKPTPLKTDSIDTCVPEGGVGQANQAKAPVLERKGSEDSFYNLVSDVFDS